MAIPKPEDIFPDANALGRVLLDKIDPATPSGICLNKDDGEKILLYVATTIMDSVYALGTAIETEIQGNVNIDGTDYTSDQRKQRLRDNLKRPLLAMANIQQQCFQQTKRYDGFYVDEAVCPITPPKEFTAEDNIETVSDHAIRNAGTFDGSKSDCPELLQTFLRSLNDIGRTSRLSEHTMVKLTQRRCLLTARTLVDNFLSSIPDISTPGTLLKLVLFLERNFALSWSPRQAKSSLAHLPQKYRNTKQFVQLQAKILQLSHLASLGEKEDDRPAFMKANQLPIFQACLAREDQDILLRLESHRRSQNLPSPNLNNAVEHILQYYAARQVSHGDLQPKTDSMIPQGSESAMHIQGSRPRGRRSDSAPVRRNGDDSRRQSSSRPRGRPPPLPLEKEAKRIPLHEKYGVPKGKCWQCSGNHLINDQSCFYRNTGMPERPCRYPGCKESGRGGMHWSAHCQTRAQANSAAGRPSSQPPPPAAAGMSSRGRSSRRGIRRDRSSRGGRSSAARRLQYPDGARQAQEASNDILDTPAFSFEE